VSANTYDATMQALDSILKSLQTDYVDLLLIHTPDYASGKLPPFPGCSNGKSSWINCRIQT
jgi:diketogulonate reductase-like aldo/keto reductase